VTRTAVSTRSFGTGRIDTTMGPLMAPAGRQRTEVRYIGTFTPCSTCRIGTPAAPSARSNVKLQPMRKPTRSSRHHSRTSVGSSVSSPST
jgi:hypothetical protein